MKEQLYTIPVNDAFSADCECPLCQMYKELEQNAVEYTMGPSYMEDDNRAMTDEAGFCAHHIRILYHQKNRLGLALMMKTHTDKTIREMKEKAKLKPQKAAGNFLKKSAPTTALGDYVRNLESRCFICERIENTFPRYVNTIFHLWKKDPDFVEKFKSSKGFCNHHYAMLYEEGIVYLGKDEYAKFIDILNDVYFTNMERVNEDISWFIDKFDYRNQNAPWKNSQDALPRGIIKTNNTFVE